MVILKIQLEKESQKLIIIELIKLLLSDKTPQKFYYKRMLWQYLKDKQGLECSASGFRAYISRKPEFQVCFE